MPRNDAGPRTTCGPTLYFGLPYYARWVTVAAKTMINKGLITPDELSAKVDEVRAGMSGAT